MNKTLLGVLAAGATVFASPAYAAAIVTYEAGPEVELNERDGVFGGTFAADVEGTGGDQSFTSLFFFDVPSDGVVSIAAISVSSLGNGNIDFTNGTINNMVGFDITNGVVDLATLVNQSISAGRNFFSLNGTVVDQNTVAGFGGDVTFSVTNAVPEPATWAMFIMGFGMLGYGLRRRNAEVRTTKARLTFA